MAQAAWEVTFIRISQQNVFLFKRREIHISLSLALALADIINFQIYKKIGRPVDNINLIFKVGEVPVEVQETRKSIFNKGGTSHQTRVGRSESFSRCLRSLISMII